MSIYLREIKGKGYQRGQDIIESQTVNIFEKEVKNDITKKAQGMFDKF